MKPSDRLLDLARQLPTGLRADWDGTNHYELTCDGPDGHWWLTVFEMDPFTTYLPDTEGGKRLGLLLDIAEELVRMREAAGE